MIFFELQKHNKLSAARSILRDRLLIHKVLYILFSVFIVVYLIFGGIGTYKIIKRLFPETDTFYVFNSILIYVFLSDLFLRSIIQKLPRISIMPYLLLPIKRKNITEYFISKTFFKIINLYLLFIIIPFVLQVNTSDYNLPIYFIGIVGLIAANQFITNIVKSLATKNILVNFIPFLILVLAFLLKFYFNIRIGEITAVFFEKLLSGNIFYLIIEFLFVTILFVTNYKVFNKLIAQEIDYRDKPKTAKKTKLNFLSNFGITGEYIKLELELIFRNKRPKQNLYVILYFIFLFVVLFSNKNSQQSTNIYLRMFFLIYLIGVFALQHGQFLFSWECSYFDFIYAYKNNLHKYLKAKFILFTASEILMSILLLPIIVILKMNLTAFFSVLIFDIGVVNFVVIYFGIYNTSQINLNRSVFANWEGMSVSNFFMSVVVGVVPLIMTFLLKFFLSETSIYLIYMFIGVVMFICNDYWLRFITKKFMLRKYISIKEFRK